MNIDKLLTNEVIERFRTREETSEERDALVFLATKVLCRKITYTCRNCYFDALLELVNLYKTNRSLFDERMKEKKYQIRRGICMPLGFGSNRMIVYQNCTDKLAIEFLSLDEKNSQYFEILPDNWKDDVAEYLGKKSDKNIIQRELNPAESDAVTDIKKMLSEGMTKGAVKEHFESFDKIGEVKATKKYVDSLIKIASEQLKAEVKDNTDASDSDRESIDTKNVE